MRMLDEKEIKQLKDCLKKKKLTKLRAVIYARKSAEDEKDTSLPTQVALCQSFVDQYDFLEVIHIFQEDNVSGMFTEGRTEYLKMMSLAEKREIDAIVVMKLDRLARDLADSLTAMKLLNSYGCHLLAGDDVSDSETPAGEFMRNVLLAQNQYHARRVASDVMSAECNNARKGETAGGKPPYGLKVVKKIFMINEDEAPAIKIMFNMTAKGKSYAQVVEKLNSLGYTTRAGKPFSYSTLYSLLRNDKYYGTYVYNREGGKRKRKRVLKEHFDEVRNATAIPPIIPKDLFDKVQKILDERKNICRPHQNTSPFILSGLVFCANCGHSMTGASGASGRSKSNYRTYSCPNHLARNGKACPTKAINADYLERFIKQNLTDYINDYLLTAKAGKIFETIKLVILEEQSVVKKQILNIEKSIKALLNKASQTSSQDLVAEYEKQATEQLEAKKQLQCSLEKLNAKMQKAQSIKNCFANGTKKLLEDDLFSSNEVARDIVRIFVNKIEVDDKNDNIEIFFNE